MTSFLSAITKVRKITDRRSKVWIAFLAVFTFFVSFIEALGVSSLMLFISVVIDQTKITTNKYLLWFYHQTQFGSVKKFIFLLGIIFIGIYVFRFVILLMHAFFVQHYSYRQYRIIATSLYYKYMSLPYQEFVKRNSTELTKNILHEANNFSIFIQCSVNFFTEVISLLLIYTILLFVKWKLTLAFTFLGVIFSLVVGKKMSTFIKQLGDRRFVTEQQLFRTIADSFGSFKTLKFIGKVVYGKDQFDRTFQDFSNSYVYSNALYALPKNIFELVGFVIIICMVFYIIIVYDNYSLVLSVLSVYVIALYKFLPSLYRSITYYNQMFFAFRTLDTVYADFQLDVPQESSEPIAFADRIDLKGISFSYHDEHPVIRDVDLSIIKGEKIAFIGESGAGKTTVVDLITGLLYPTRGHIFIDDKPLTLANIISWRNKVGYVPQSIYLFDGTVADNVVFGQAYDKDKIISVLKQAKIWDYLASKDGVNTRVGENGVQISGGQKQRIGIARALYKDPEILVLDEATSALDSKTEDNVISEIFHISADKTVIVIAHRLSTISNCKKVYLVENNNVRLRE